MSFISFVFFNIFLLPPFIACYVNSSCMFVDRHINITLWFLAGVLACLDGYMNIALEQTEEYANGQVSKFHLHTQVLLFKISVAVVHELF